ncbi:MAG: TonB-dependent receptor [Pseudomonadota bacterium]
MKRFNSGSGRCTRHAMLAADVRRALRRRAIPAGVATGVLFASTGAALAQELTLEEVVVTAQKRTQNLQDVPVSVNVLGEQKLDELNITGFADYFQFLPTVSAQQFGPGQAQIYMRGVSDGGDGNFSGTTPSVALYLDDQPVTAIGRNLDVHVYDISRIETLAGPQGTLYGANSQAGALRIITNKPDPSAFAAGVDVGGNTVKGGDAGYSVEGFANVPLSDNAAIRLVGWRVEDGGWIDVVPASLTLSRSGITVSNSGNANPDQNTVEEDYNTLTNTGARAALGIDLNDSWTATASVIAQMQQSDGVFADQPGLNGPGQGRVERFFQDNYEDTWTQLGLTLTGDLGFADITFAGSYLDREVEYDIDYSQYSEYSAYIEYYYTCVNYDFNNCTDPRIQYENDSAFKRSSIEVRLQSKADRRLRWVAGLFYNNDEHDYFNQWVIPTIPDGNDIPLNRNINGREDLYFATNQQRDFSEIAVFGEVTLDLTEKLSATVGLRWFETDDDLTGFVGSRFSCFDPADGNRIGNGTSTSADCGGGLGAKIDDFTTKVNASYQFSDDVLVYATYSEGFRPGGVNREPSPVIPQIYQPDFLKNYEVGWKTTFANGRARFNGAAYVMDWEDLQLTRFDVESFGSFLGLTANTGGADIIGIEGDFEVLVTEGWTLSGGFSYNDAELSEDFFVGTTDTTPAAPEGTDLPFTPDLKYTLISRHTFNVAGRDAYFQAAWNWTDSSQNDLFVDGRLEQDSYGLLNLSGGVRFGNTNLDVYVNNVTDENAQLTLFSRGGDDRVVANRPLSVGMRFSMRFE